MEEQKIKDIAETLYTADLRDGRYKNPILFADYSDPDVIRVGEDYYLVASSFNCVPSVPLLHSRDLIHWNLIGYCIDRLPGARYDQPMHGSGAWAPSIRFHDGTFYVFVPFPDEGIFVARTKDPYGTWSLNCIREGVGWIDPCPLWDEDGRAYMVFAYANSRCGIKHRLSVCEMTPDAERLLGEPVTIFDGVMTNPTLEGPKFYKRNGYYYIFAPAGGVATGWQTVLRARQIYGPYDYRIVMHQGNTDVNGPHQGGYVETPAGKGYFLHFQDRDAYGRILHLQPVDWAGDWPFIGMEQDGDGIGEPVAAWELPVLSGPDSEIGGPANGAIPTGDTFDGKALGLQWQWQANPRDAWYSLSAHKGALRLYVQDNPDREENLLWYAPGVLTQLLQAPAFTVTAALTLLPEEEGDFAGIGMIGHAYTGLGIERRGGHLRLMIVKGKVTEPENAGTAKESVVFTEPATADTLTLRLTLTQDAAYHYAYSTNGKSYTDIPIGFPLVRGTWTGAKFALFALNRENRSSRGAADFDYVHFTPSKSDAK